MKNRTIVLLLALMVVVTFCVLTTADNTQARGEHGCSYIQKDYNFKDYVQVRAEENKRYLSQNYKDRSREVTKYAPKMKEGKVSPCMKERTFKEYAKERDSDVYGKMLSNPKKESKE